MKHNSSFKISLVLIVFTLMCIDISYSVNIEHPTMHISYIDQVGYAGWVTGEEYASDGNWNTYAQVTSNGNHSDAIVWYVKEEWIIPQDAMSATFDVKIEAPDPYVWQGQQESRFWNYIESDWNQVFLSLSYSHEIPPPLSGFLETSIEIIPDWISGNGEINTLLYFFQKHNSGSWSRLYDTRITYIPEPATLLLLGLGGLLFRRQRAENRRQNK